MTIHAKRTKTNKCSTCNQMFFTAGELKRHTQVHTRDKSVSCTLCASSIVEAKGLRKHMMNIHQIGGI